MNFNIQQRRVKREVNLYRSRILSQLNIIKNSQKRTIVKHLPIEIIDQKSLLRKLKTDYPTDAWKFHMKYTSKRTKFYGLIKLDNQKQIDLKLGDLVIVKRSSSVFDDLYEQQDSDDSEDQSNESTDSNESNHSFESNRNDVTIIKSQPETQSKIFAEKDPLLSLAQFQCQICENFSSLYFESLMKRKQKNKRKELYLSIIRYVNIFQQKQLLKENTKNNSQQILQTKTKISQQLGKLKNGKYDSKIVLIAKIGTSKLMKYNLSQGQNQVDLITIDIEIQRQIRAVKNMKSELNLKILKHLFFSDQFQHHKYQHKTRIQKSLDKDTADCMNHIASHTFSIIKTPPGTSHDDLINQICFHYLGKKNKNNYKILVTGPTNFSVNQSSVELYQNVTKKIVRIFSMDIFEFNEEDRISEIISEISEKTKILQMIIRQQNSFSKYFTKSKFQKKLVECFRSVLGAKAASIDELFKDDEYRGILEIPLRIRLKFILSQRLAGNEYYSDQFEKIIKKIQKISRFNFQNADQFFDLFIDQLVDDLFYPSSQFILELLLTGPQKVKLLTHKKIMQQMKKENNVIQYDYTFNGIRKLLCYLIFIPRLEQWICHRIQVKSYQVLNLPQELYGYEYMMKMLGNVISEQDIVTCTCIKAGYSIINKFNFDIIIINQAAQTNQLNALIAMTHRPIKVVILGDDSQLKIVNVKKNKQEKKLAQLNHSLLERLVYQDHPCKKLKFQTQMNPVIADFINKNFYENQLLQKLKHKNQFQPLLFSTCLQTNKSMIIKDVNIKGSYLEKLNDKSYYNYHEVIQIKSIIEKIYNNNKNLLKEVGIITPYKSQSLLLRQKLDNYRQAHGLQISTIDGFHGQTRDYIIISMVRSNFDGDIGFMREQKRINVCLTRARKGICLVCDVQTVLKSKSKIWKKFIQHDSG